MQLLEGPDGAISKWALEEASALSQRGFARPSTSITWYRAFETDAPRVAQKSLRRGADRDHHGGTEGW